MIAADRQHRHGQLALGEEGLIIDAILREIDKLLQRIVRGVRPGIRFGIMNARDFTSLAAKSTSSGVIN